MIKLKYFVRLIEEKDDKIIEKIIRDCLIEYNAAKEGTAWADPTLSTLSKVYNEPKTVYYVAEDEEGNIVGGCGIGKLDGVENTCELQKMYCIQSVRGTGVAEDLLNMCLAFAKKYYNSVYLETLDNMERAHRFYEKHGFKKTDERLGNTGHHNCGVLYILKFKTTSRFIEVMGEIFGELFGYLIIALLGILMYIIFPKDCRDEIDFEWFILLGSIVFVILPCLVVMIIRLFFKRKENRK